MIVEHQELTEKTFSDDTNLVSLPLTDALSSNLLDLQALSV